MSNDNEFFDKERAKKIVYVLLKTAPKIPEFELKEAVWGGLEALANELEKPDFSDSTQSSEDEGIH